MLNTDAHNVHIKTKLTQDVFLKNNRGINGGKDFPDEFLKELYSAVVGEPGLLPGLYLQGWRCCLIVTRVVYQGTMRRDSLLNLLKKQHWCVVQHGKLLFYNSAQVQENLGIDTIPGSYCIC